MYNNQPKIIGVTGTKESGKNTFGSYLVNNYGFTENAFAKPLKDASKILFGLNDEQLYDSEKKEQYDSKIGYSPREVLQKFGTEIVREQFANIFPNMFRNSYKNLWIKLMDIFINTKENENKFVVITDLRFQDEAEWVKNKGGIIVKINRQSIKKNKYSEHKSETELNTIKANYIIKNNGSIQNLYNNIDKLMTNLNFQKQNEEKDYSLFIFIVFILFISVIYLFQDLNLYI